MCIFLIFGILKWRMVFGKSLFSLKKNSSFSCFSPNIEKNWYSPLWGGGKMPSQNLCWYSVYWSKGQDYTFFGLFTNVASHGTKEWLPLKLYEFSGLLDCSCARCRRKNVSYVLYADLRMLVNSHYPQFKQKGRGIFFFKYAKFVIRSKFLSYILDSLKAQ